MGNGARQYSFLDKCLMNFDQMLQTVAAKSSASVQPNPAGDCLEASLTTPERRYVAGLMRVNHTGEVCAQALYQGQALTARTPTIRAKLEQAAQEESDHLAWCAQRLNELNSHTSFLNPLWYMGSLTIGITAGLISDQVNLGFLAETERQVEQHLTNHLQKIPTTDQRSRKIIEKMRADEAQHATTAMQAGAAELPKPVKLMMRCMSKIMTGMAFWI
jgi:ubiquinone biosynthesis monooxygenase Coq7